MAFSPQMNGAAFQARHSNRGRERGRGNRVILLFDCMDIPFFFQHPRNLKISVTREKKCICRIVKYEKHIGSMLSFSFSVLNHCR